MSGEPIQELSKGLTLFQQRIDRDEIASLRTDLAILDSQAEIVCDFTTVAQLDLPQLVAKGENLIDEAIKLALDRIEERKQTYTNNDINYYQPWMLLISSAAKSDRIQKVAQRVRTSVSEQKLSFFAVAVNNANIDTLKQIAPVDTPPLRLDDLKFSELFKWLSDSIATISHHQIGEKIQLADISGWMKH